MISLEQDMIVACFVFSLCSFYPESERSVLVLLLYVKTPYDSSSLAHFVPSKVSRALGLFIVPRSFF